LCGFFYGGDYCVLRYRVWRNRNPYGTVHVEGYYAMPLKNGKTEILPMQPQDQTCVNSIFPHFGDPPCWYLRRHSETRVDL